MNRRDIIITAVLINAGLLIVLFISSLKSHDPKELVMTKKEVVEKKPKVAAAKKEVAPAPPKTPLDKALAAHKAAEPKKEVAKKPEAKVAAKPEALAVVEVSSGDALEKIARRHNVDVDELMRINNLTSARLQIGQKLKVPSAKKVAQKTEAKRDEKGEYYIIRHGDNLWNIAREHKIKFEELLDLNNLDEEKSRRLKPGERIRIK
ncbi:MAG: LysM peptidoglycan-binding domain-containing protein [Candidatus Algichlamydia australiensis]|nr:LysM peptidoglycan-binding domain-containing protein [Chlamydiales bacterium]